jgi:hypothetical protein
MPSSAFPAITEAEDDKDQGGPPMNSCPVAIAFGMPAVMIDSPAVPGFFRPPEDDDIVVVDRRSKRGPTGRKVSFYVSLESGARLFEYDDAAVATRERAARLARQTALVIT